MNSRIGIVPYAELQPGIRTVSDQIILGFAVEAIQDGTFWRVFVDSPIDSPETFLNAMKSPANVPVFFFVGTDPIGVAWLNGCNGSRAFAHFLFLRKAWGKHTLQAGKIGLEYWFSFKVGDESLFDVILGVIPSRNERAVGYVRRLGFSVLGNVPKMFRFDDVPCEGTIVYLTR